VCKASFIIAKKSKQLWSAALLCCVVCCLKIKTTRSNLAAEVCGALSNGAKKRAKCGPVLFGVWCAIGGPGLRQLVAQMQFASVPMPSLAMFVAMRSVIADAASVARGLHFDFAFIASAAQKLIKNYSNCGKALAVVIQGRQRWTVQERLHGVIRSAASTVT